MSLADDLAAVFAEVELTVPVLHVRTGTVVRGFLDAGLETVTGGPAGVSVNAGTHVLHVARGAIVAPVLDDLIQVGQLGAEAVVDGDPQYLNRGAVQFHDDGAFDHLALAVR